MHSGEKRRSALWLNAMHSYPYSSLTTQQQDNSDLTQKDGRMAYKNVAQDGECAVSRHIFSSFCRPESYHRPVA